MPAALRSGFGSLLAGIRQFTLAQRTVAIIGLAVLALGVTALVSWLTAPSYSPLFTGLQAADANAIVEQLRSDGVAYELADGGATVMVPREAVYDERLKAASAGLPSSSDGGYSLLDEMGVTASEFQQSVTYKRALEGELASTISALDGVQTASVRLAIPEETVFVDQKADPTASVFIETRNGTTLTSAQVEAVVHLTSASIEGMKPEDVAVVDSTGKVLSAVGVGATGGADEQASDYEGRIENAVQAMLDRVVGAGNATVVVAADVSSESAERVEESYTGAGDIPAINESTTKETYQGGAGTAAGVLGPDNIAVPDGATGDGAYESESATKNNAVNKVTETRTIPAGSLARQTVSVAVNSDAENIDVTGLRSLVSSAAGIDTTRGDVVTVETVPFSTAGATDAAAALAAAKEAAAAEQLASLIRTAVITLGIAIPVVIAIIVIARRSRRRDAEALEFEEAQQTQQLEQTFAAPTAIDMIPTLPIDTVELSNSAMLGQADAGRRLAEIEAMAGRDPQKTAEFLRALMDDRQPV
ncbi:flagellar basal-body MS-ring/collar protein FliF [Leifsonia sp. YIM 134122]|uniref:Flagellar M-ring protein n=1 Tax=Leifsonia stereocauli TaxID=3134136 RepID=A0ABU9W2J0_9MICO